MERIEIRPPRFAASVAVICCALLLCITVYLFGPLPEPTAGRLAVSMAYLGARLAAVGIPACLLLVGLGVLRDRRPLLVIDAHGVSARSIRPARLRWSQVAGARRVQRLGDDGAVPIIDLLCIDLSDPSSRSELLIPPRGLPGWLARMRWSGRGDIEIDLSTTTADVGRLVTIINGNAGRRAPRADAR